MSRDNVMTGCADNDTDHLSLTTDDCSLPMVSKVLLLFPYEIVCCMLQQCCNCSQVLAHVLNWLAALDRSVGSAGGSASFAG